MLYRLDIFNKCVKLSILLAVSKLGLIEEPTYNHTIMTLEGEVGRKQAIEEEGTEDEKDKTKGAEMFFLDQRQTLTYKAI